MLIVGTTGADQTKPVTPNIYQVIAGAGKVIASKKGSAAGMLLLGAHGGLTAPVSLGGLGMTGCELGVLPLVAFPISVPATGSLNIPLPIPANISRSAIDVQLVLTETGANKANLITSQVGSIILR